MSIEDRIQATAKNIQGKAQEMLGDMTDDPKAKAKGKAKQIEAKATQVKEDFKDEVKKRVD